MDKGIFGQLRSGSTSDNFNKMCDEQKFIQFLLLQTGSSGSSVSGEESKGEDQTVPERADRLELASVNEGDEDGDDDILADCISIGMQDTR